MVNGWPRTFPHMQYYRSRSLRRGNLQTFSRNAQVLLCRVLWSCHQLHKPNFSPLQWRGSVIIFGTCDFSCSLMSFVPLSPFHNLIIDWIEDFDLCDYSCICLYSFRALYRFVATKLKNFDQLDQHDVSSEGHPSHRLYQYVLVYLFSFLFCWWVTSWHREDEFENSSIQNPRARSGECSPHPTERFFVGNYNSIPSLCGELVLTRTLHIQHSRLREFLSFQGYRSYFAWRNLVIK